MTWPRFELKTPVEYSSRAGRFNHSTTEAYDEVNSKTLQNLGRTNDIIFFNINENRTKLEYTRYGWHLNKGKREVCMRLREIILSVIPHRFGSGTV